MVVTWLLNMDYLHSDSFVSCWENLSPYYITCVILSFSAVLLTWWYREQNTTPLQNRIVPDNDGNDVRSESKGILTEMKVARRAAIDRELSEGMSEAQLQQEKETEKEQLAAIFDLLCKQEQKFHVNSMEELQSQLKLYRR